MRRFIYRAVNGFCTGRKFDLAAQKIYHNNMTSDQHDEKNEGHPEEMVGRYVTGAFGQPILTILARRYWDYFDWIFDARDDYRNRMTANADLIRQDCTMSEALIAMMQVCEKNFDEKGIKPPAGLRSPSAP